MIKKLTKESSLTFIELPPTRNGIFNERLAGDVYSIANLPSRALPLLTEILKLDGWKNIQEINPKYHGTKNRLNKNNFERIFDSDVLLASSISRTAPQTMYLLDLYKKVKPDGMAIVGGFDPSFRNKEWLKHADIVVQWEAEKTISKLMNALTKDPDSLDDILGISYITDSGMIYENQRRPLLSSKDLDDLPLIRYDKKTVNGISTSPLETSRGCPFDCNFCTVTEFYGGSYRFYSIDHVLDQFDYINDFGSNNMFVNNIILTDDNVAGNPKRAKELFKQIAKRSIKKTLITQLTVQAAYNQELLDIMKKARVETLCVGIESVIDETLKSYNKPFNADYIKEGIRRFRENGYWIHGMMILGGEADTKESIEETDQWINDNLDSIQLFAPTPLPGSRLYNQMKSEDRILTEDMHLYDLQHVVVRPKNISPYDLQKKISSMYENFYSLKNAVKRTKNSTDPVCNIFITLYAKYGGGLRVVTSYPEYKNHLNFLKSKS